MQTFPPSEDVDASLYDGFLNEHDRRQCRQVVGATPAELAGGGFHFQDGRLEELLFRYRARNWPESLNESERERWPGHLEVLYQSESRGLEAWFREIAERRAEHSGDPRKLGILEALEGWGDDLLAGAA